ncbi:hypothetical protein [uncultured Phycicoccus sp.]|uniref:hypothetical protein n=1 Tax=uncultured Phycicoccus sp. TaxID=661422 RepID=UPI00260745BD|nr:hypothetical protein [uncultured Phycicoccus sp.]
MGLKRTRGTSHGAKVATTDRDVVEDERDACSRRGVPPVDPEALGEPGWPERGPRPGGGAAWA